MKRRNKIIKKKNEICVNDTKLDLGSAVPAIITEINVTIPWQWCEYDSHRIGVGGCGATLNPMTLFEPLFGKTRREDHSWKKSNRSVIIRNRIWSHLICEKIDKYDFWK